MKSERVAKWDNIKFFMMLSVVLGHTIYLYVDSLPVAKMIYLFIYTYHMPVFIFVCGLFSKRTVQLKKYEKVVEYLMIYIFIKFLQSLGEYLLKREDLRFHFLWEDGPAWFALAIAVFLFASMLLSDIDQRYLFVFAVFLGCVAGLDNHFGDHFASMRICTFYPVFLAGLYLDPEKINLTKAPKSTCLLLKICSFLFLNICLLASIRYIDKLYPYYKILKGKFAYSSMNMTMRGVAYRFICYIFWCVIIAAIIYVNTNSKRIYTWLGTRTLSIFIWHNFFIVLIFKVYNVKSFLKNNLPHTYFLVSICIAVLITILTAYLPSIKLPIKKKGVQ